MCGGISLITCDSNTSYLLYNHLRRMSSFSAILGIFASISLIEIEFLIWGLSFSTTVVPSGTSFIKYPKRSESLPRHLSRSMSTLNFFLHKNTRTGVDGPHRIPLDICHRYCHIENISLQAQIFALISLHS